MEQSRPAHGDVLEPIHPWPLPAALAFASGLATAAADMPWGVSVAFAVGVAWPLRLLLLRPLPGFGARPGRRALIALLLPLVLIPIGYARYRYWRALPNPLAPLLGTNGVFSGVGDGSTLLLDGTSRARVAVAPQGSVPAGRVTVEGTLLLPEGMRNPGGFDYREYLLRRGIHAQLRVERVVEAEPRAPPRQWLAEGASKGLPPREAALMQALTLGIRDDLGELRDDFAAAGIAHILALSGLHVGILVAAVAWLLTPLGPYRFPVLLMLIAGFVVLVGGGPSVVRAGIMLAVALIGLWTGAGRLQPWTVLGLSALITLLVRPAWILDVSFQLSYGAVGGILLFAAPLMRATSRVGHVAWWDPRALVVGSAGTSLAAQALTLPLVIHHFAALPLLSPLVNVVALPLATLLVPLGFATVVAGAITPAGAAALNVVTERLASALIALAEVGARMPQLYWGEVGPRGLLLYLVAVTALALAAHRFLRPRRALLVLAVTMTASAVASPVHPPPEFIALDVGQGDSFLIRLPDRIEVLVDGGGTPFSDFDTGSQIVVPALRALGVDELELVVATHADADHVEGLVSVLEQVPVQLLAYGRHEPEREVFAGLMTTAKATGTPTVSLVRGQLIRLPGADIEVLNPSWSGYGTSNDDSVALRVSIHGGSRVLLLGDVSARVEHDLAPLEADVLVAPHHGSSSSTSARLLQAASPDTVIISVGVNRYGHPSPIVLDRLAQAGVVVHSTRESGAVRVKL